MFLNMRFSAVIVCALISSFSHFSEARDTAQKNDIDNKHNEKNIEEIVVTAAQPNSLIDIPRSVSVISAIDIERSGASNIPQLLQRQANISLTSVSGNSKFTSADIRGSGATAVSNVLVLIDGIRLNIPDLNGVEFALVPLDQIERIEIVRGANAVRFGDGASQGVINILTKSNTDTSALSLKTTIGSFDKSDTSLRTVLANQQHQFSFLYDNEFNDGFRDHNQFSADTYLASYRYTPSSNFSSQLIGRANIHDYQLPGSLSFTELERGEISPTDSVDPAPFFGDNDDKSLHHIIRWQSSTQLALRSIVHYRDRENFFSTVGAPFKDRITLDSYGIELTSQYEVPQARLQWHSGIELRRQNYDRSENGINTIGRTINIGELETTAFFSTATFAITQTIRLQLGARTDRTKSDFERAQLSVIQDETSPDCAPFGGFLVCPNSPDSPQDVVIDTRNETWRNEAFEVSALIDLSQRVRLHISAAKTFRNPNVDELVLATDSLEPQSAERYELGIKSAENVWAGLIWQNSLNLFASRTDNEILFLSIGGSAGGTNAGLNINAPPIKRTGVEFSLRARNRRGFSAAYNAGYTDAKNDFGLRVPLVTRFNQSLALAYEISGFSINTSIVNVSSRLDGNDDDNQLRNIQGFEIPGYTLINLNINYKQALPHGEITFFAGVNNLDDRLYLTASFSQTVFPGNGREFFGGIKYEL